MENYPEEFTELQQRPSEELAECCDKLFELYNTFCESSMKRKAVVWPLQMMLLVLCPKILEEITNAETGAPCSPNHVRKVSGILLKYKFKNRYNSQNFFFSNNE